MMMVPVTVGRSAIHGLGVFAVSPIKKDRVVWQFEPGLDRSVTDYSVRYGDPRIEEFARARGYINPDKPFVWILCIDEAQFLNFPLPGQEANLCLGGIIEGEHLLLAAREIEHGEELTVPPESDADYKRKIAQR